MSRRKLSENRVRSLTKVGQGSLSVTIPVHIVRKLELRERQKVVVTERGGKISIVDWKA